MSQSIHTRSFLDASLFNHSTALILTAVQMLSTIGETDVQEQITHLVHMPYI